MSASKVTNAVSFKPVEVPEALQEGDKFIKWDEVQNLYLFTISPSSSIDY